MNRIDIYGHENCTFCLKVKKLLVLKGYQFNYHDILASDESRAEFERRCPNAKTVPQVFIGETLVGGYSETLAAIMRGHFQQTVGGF